MLESWDAAVIEDFSFRHIQTTFQLYNISTFQQKKNTGIIYGCKG